METFFNLYFLVTNIYNKKAGYRKLWQINLLLLNQLMEKYEIVEELNDGWN